MRTTRTLAAIGTALALSAPVVSYVAGSAFPAQAGEVIRDHPVVHGVIAEATGRACAEEDDVDCFWNARTMGNGVGHSFYAVRVSGDVCVIYWGRKFNRRHGYCTPIR